MPSFQQISFRVTMLGGAVLGFVAAVIEGVEKGILVVTEVAQVVVRVLKVVMNGLQVVVDGLLVVGTTIRGVNLLINRIL